ncbi:MAG: neutral/alkaline non-lysosomal ceramidase N-terminal domain-containing protein [Bacteroidota bacterium]
MKKWLKILLITSGIIVTIIFAAGCFVISSIDKTPYFETTYYKNTTERLNNVLSNRITTEGNLQAGFAKINITPKIISGDQKPSKGEFNTIKLAGFGKGQNAVGVHDSLFAKAIALDVAGKKAILISADLLLMPPEVVDKVVEKLKKRSDITRGQLFFGATHTHSSIGNCIPKFVGKQFGGEYQPGVVEWLSEKITKVILQSVSDLKIAQFAHGYIHAPNLVANRLIGETGRLNDKLTVISIKQDEGKHAAIGIFAAHPTIIGTWNNQFSGDYPGYFQRTLEDKGIDMAMFFGGTVGSHTNKGEGEKFEKADFVGKSLADSATVAFNKMEYSDSVVFSSITSEIEIPKLQAIYITDNWRLSPWLGKKLMPKVKSTYLQALQLNNLIWLTQPAELSGEYAIDLKNALELKGYNAAITSFNGQYLGYIIPAKYYYYDTYEARLMGWYGPGMGDYLMELNYTIADSLTRNKL